MILGRQALLTPLITGLGRQGATLPGSASAKAAMPQWGHQGQSASASCHAVPHSSPHQSADRLETLKLLIYLVPIFGTVPAALSMARTRTSPRERAVSRLVLTLAFSWLALYVALGAGSELAPGLSLRLLVTNLLVTTGYTVTSLGLMVRLLQGKPVKLPGFSRLSQRLP